jgi:hypothetical protein
MLHVGKMLAIEGVPRTRDIINNQSYYALHSQGSTIDRHNIHFGVAQQLGEMRKHAGAVVANNAEFLRFAGNTSRVRHCKFLLNLN